MERNKWIRYSEETNDEFMIDDSDIISFKQEDNFKIHLEDLRGIRNVLADDEISSEIGFKGLRKETTETDLNSLGIDYFDAEQGGVFILIQKDTLPGEMYLANVGILDTNTKSLCFKMFDLYTELDPLLNIVG